MKRTYITLSIIGALKMVRSDFVTLARLTPISTESIVVHHAQMTLIPIDSWLAITPAGIRVTTAVVRAFQVAIAW